VLRNLIVVSNHKSNHIIVIFQEVKAKVTWLRRF